MDIIISKELKESIGKVAELIKADVRYSVMKTASDNYNSSEELNALLDEYGVLQSKLTAEYDKDEFSENAVKVINDRMNEIYSKVVSHPVYQSFKDASQDYSDLIEAVYSELEFAVSGKKEPAGCTHDCSTCGGCC